MSEINEAIQEDFSIKLNGIPILKKFPKFLDFNKTFCQSTKLFTNFTFGLYIKDGIIKIVPCINDIDYINSLRNKIHYDKLAEFIIYQMINSGTLPFLKNIEIQEHDRYAWIYSDEKPRNEK